MYWRVNPAAERLSFCRRTHFGRFHLFESADCQRTAPALFGTVPGGELRVVVGRFSGSAEYSARGEIGFVPEFFIAEEVIEDFDNFGFDCEGVAGGEGGFVHGFLAWLRRYLRGHGRWFVCNILYFSQMVLH